MVATMASAAQGDDTKMIVWMVGLMMIVVSLLVAAITNVGFGGQKNTLPNCLCKFLVCSELLRLPCLVFLCALPSFLWRQLWVENSSCCLFSYAVFEAEFEAITNGAATSQHRVDCAIGIGNSLCEATRAKSIHCHPRLEAFQFGRHSGLSAFRHGLSIKHCC